METNKSYYVDEIKKTVNQISNDIDDVDILYDLKQSIKDLIHRIEHEHQGIYLAIFDVGPDDDFIRYYKPLGRMTLAQAYEKLSELGEDEGAGEESVREITEEEWNDFIHLGYLSQIETYFNCIKRYDNFPEEAFKEISKQIKELRTKLNLRYRWEKVERP